MLGGQNKRQLTGGAVLALVALQGCGSHDSTINAGVAVPSSPPVLDAAIVPSMVGVPGSPVAVVVRRDGDECVVVETDSEPWRGCLTGSPDDPVRVFGARQIGDGDLWYFVVDYRGTAKLSTGNAPGMSAGQVISGTSTVKVIVGVTTESIGLRTDNGDGTGASLCLLKADAGPGSGSCE